MTEFFNKQIEHEPTKNYLLSLKRFLAMVKFKSLYILEVGTGSGLSTRTFLEDNRVKKLVTIDNGEQSQARKEAIELGKKDKLFTIWGNSQEAVPKLTEKFNLVFIDADHSSKAVEADLKNCWEKTKKNGYILLHDILHYQNFTEGGEVKILKTVNEFIKQKKVDLYILYEETGLGYIRKNEI